MDFTNSSSKRTLQASEITSIEAEAKRVKCKSTEADSKPTENNEDIASVPIVEEIVDVTTSLSLKAGSRIEVRWELHFDEDENNPKLETRWWGGTLLEADGRTHTLQNGNDKVTVQIHSIDYDPYLPNFPDRSIEDVCFLSNRSLLNISSVSRTCWRLEGDSWEPSAQDLEEVADETTPNNGVEYDANEDDDEISVASTSQEDGLREVLDTILKTALESSGVMAKMRLMERSKQSIMAEKIASTKEKLITKFLEKLNNENDNASNGVDRVITPELVQNVMAELGNELRG